MKHILKRVISLLLVLLLLCSTAQTFVFAETEGSAQYLNNQGALTETELMQLPVGAVKAEGWLENQMLLMKENITGLMKEHRYYNAETSAWLGAEDGEAWEKGPYYARGVVAMAYILEDEELLEEGLKWVAAIIDSQDADGLFGPEGSDLWSRMPALNVVRDFYEGAENKAPVDRTAKEQEYMEKVIPFFENYFRYELNNLSSIFNDSWDKNRMADNIEIVYWLYNRQYDAANSEETAWLMELVAAMDDLAAKWDEIAQTTTVRAHVVNTTQALKYSPIMYQYEPDSQSLREGFAKMIDNIGLDHGRVDDMPNADEGAADNQPFHGTELCAVTEGIISAGIALEVYDEAWIGDWMETIAYNSLPAAFPADYSSQSYFVQQNQPIATQGIHEFSNDYGTRTAYSAPAGFECCFPNCHSAWPKFVQNMWMATNTGGLALTAYGPNNVIAKVNGGKTAIIKQTTDYPFKNTVCLDYLGEDASFDLRLRVPEWAKGVTITVNGVSYSNAVAGEFYTIEREWTDGDVVTVSFDAKVTLSRWYNNSTAVEYGALIYSLQIDEDWRKYVGADIGAAKPTEEQPDWEVYPASDWNYGLVTDENAVFEVVEKDVGLAPFSNANAPTLIKAKGVLLKEWMLDGNNAGNPPYGPIRYDESKMVDITLVPYGCPNIRITQFPTMNNSEATDKVFRTDSRIIKRSGVTYQEFDNVVVPAADNYNLKITAEGKGTVIINSNYVQEINGNTVIENLRDLSAIQGSFAFKERQFNNIRFTGDVTVSEIEIEPVAKEHTSIRVISANRKGNTADIQTNLSVAEVPYELWYGTESGKYTHKTMGFDNSVATLRDLDAQKTYYVVAKALIAGRWVTSAEIKLDPVADDGVLRPAVNAIAPAYDGFANAEDVQGNWTLVDPDGVISTQKNDNVTSMVFGSSRDVKAILNIEDSKYWTDYAVEAKLTLSDDNNANAGIIFRCSDYGAGANGFKGYYAGISKTGVLIIYANGNGWSEIASVTKSLSMNREYTLRVVIYDNMFAVYLNGELIKIVEDELYSNGTVGLRSYLKAFSVSDFKVSTLTLDDLADLQEYVNPSEEEAIVVRPEYNKASYTGLGTTKAETEADFTFYDPSSLIHANADGSLYIGKGTQVKAALNVANANEWVDYVVEAKIAFSENTGTNAGIMFRVDPNTIGDGPDALDGYYVGIKNTGVEVGYFNQAWKKITTVARTLTAGQVYDLKVVVYDNMFAAYLDEELVYLYTDTARLHPNGTVGVRSYNQAFTTSTLSVRGVTASDLMVFGGDPSFYEDFEDGNDGAWTLYGDTNSMTFANGQLQFAQHANVKAVAGDADWGNYVVDVEIDLKSNTGNDWRNAGIAFRVSDAKSGTDAFNGYYFGIGATMYTTGKWKQSFSGFALNAPYEFGNGKHKLTAVAEGSVLMFYVDGKLIDIYNDSTYASGQIALRSYNRAFSADNVTVRSMNDTEKADLAAYLAKGMKISVSAVSAEKLIQLKYPKVGEGLTSRIVYGKESGVYTDTYTDLPCFYGVNKVAFSVSENGTYYVKLYMMDGDTVVAQSDEIVITTGFIDDTTSEKAELSSVLATARTTDTSSFTKDSLERLRASIVEAEAVVSKQDAHQMDYRLARDMLSVALNTPDTVYPEAHIWESDFTIDRPAACSTDGSMSIHCSHCTLTKNITRIPATGKHTVGDLVVDTAATCVSKGVGHKECTACGKTLESNIEIAVDPDAHTGNTHIENAKDATCAEKGYTGDTVCECGVTISKGEEIPMASHTAGEWKTVKEATTTATGLKEQRCTACDELLDTKIIAKTKGVDTLTIFKDIKKNDWFVKNGSIDYAYNMGFFKGATSTTFEPNTSVTRGMFVTVLGRLHGVKEVKATTQFSDVKKSAYYSGFVAWAAKNGVVTGTSATTFEPEASVTREQICAMMYRYCDYAGIELQKINPKITFADANKISGYAKTAVAACQRGAIVNGKENNKFDPTGNATRAEVATILMNFCENYK